MRATGRRFRRRSDGSRRCATGSRRRAGRPSRGAYPGGSDRASAAAGAGARAGRAPRRSAGAGLAARAARRAEPACRRPPCTHGDGHHGYRGAAARDHPRPAARDGGRDPAPAVGARRRLGDVRARPERDRDLLGAVADRRVRRPRLRRPMALLVADRAGAPAHRHPADGHRLGPGCGDAQALRLGAGLASRRSRSAASARSCCSTGRRSCARSCSPT